MALFQASRLLHVLMQDKRLADLVANTHHRVQAGEWVLHDEGNLLASNISQFFLLKPDQIFAIQLYGAGADPSRRLKHPHDCKAGHGFATSRFAHDSKCLPRFQVKRDPAKDARRPEGNL